jgi:protein phosphatase
MHQPELTWGAASDVGRRSENQDRYLAAAPVFAVADGMGGHTSGGAASEAVIARLAALAVVPTVAVDALREALRCAEEDIKQLGRAGDDADAAGTTVVGLALTENAGALYWAAFHIGDSRIYRCSSAGLEQVTHDHSVVQELLDGGLISEAQALVHPQRHMITRALGFGSRGEAEFTLLPVDPGERFLVCSDGLSGVLSKARIGEMMAAQAAEQVLADALVAEAVDAGAQDNVTAVVLRVGAASAGSARGRAESVNEDTAPLPPIPPLRTDAGGDRR